MSEPLTQSEEIAILRDRIAALSLLLLTIGPSALSAENMKKLSAAIKTMNTKDLSHASA